MINESKAYYWLSLSGATAKRLNAILSVYSCLEIWERLSTDIALQDAFKGKAANLLKLRNIDFINESLNKIKRCGINIMTRANENYPKLLNQKEVSPPIVIYYKGNLDCLKNECIAIVGTRQATSYGADVAKKFASDLVANGITVVSGLATGIDSFAHEAVVNDKGKTVAVLGGGFDYLSPYAVSLAEKIIGEGGIILTEYAPSFFPTKYTFPERNRIISGLSKAVIVIEAADRSGALITASYAIEQNREVYAVPGGVNAIRSEGCNKLIKNGMAAMVTSVVDVLTDLRINVKKTKKTALTLNIFEQKIYDKLIEGTTHLDDIIQLGFSLSELTTILINLEMRQIIKKQAGNYYSLVL
ncbi:MAG: DNA-processing protein DprA [Firmicutes bacterium]|nr:DNA-processing protein DprA [Bacillota bacterium]